MLKSASCGVVAPFSPLRSDRLPAEEKRQRFVLNPRTCYVLVFMCFIQLVCGSGYTYIQKYQEPASVNVREHIHRGYKGSQHKDFTFICTSLLAAVAPLQLNLQDILCV